MTVNPFRWLDRWKLRKRAQAIALPTFNAVQSQLWTVRRLQSQEKIDYLRSELASMIRDLRNKHQQIQNAWTDKALAKNGLQQLERLVNQGSEEVIRTSWLIESQDKIRGRINHADATVAEMYATKQHLPFQGTKRHRDALARIKGIKKDLAGTKRQHEFHHTLQAFEGEVDAHREWLRKLESTETQIVQLNSDLESWVSSTTWTTTKIAEEGIERARANLDAARSFWETANPIKTADRIQDAAKNFAAAREACDRTLNHAREEAAMWRDFFRAPRSYPAMQQSLAAFPPELQSADLQRWADFRLQNEHEIHDAVLDVSHLTGTMSFRTVPAMNLGENIDFPQKVLQDLSSVVAELRKRHRKRRRTT
jgi:hypothetical protein